MPVLDPDTAFVLQLYQRCHAFNCLPFAGGLVDQPEWIMKLFDIIDSIAAKVRHEIEGEARLDAHHEKAKWQTT